MNKFDPFVHEVLRFDFLVGRVMITRHAQIQHVLNTKDPPMLGYTTENKDTFFQKKISNLFVVKKTPFAFTYMVGHTVLYLHLAAAIVPS